VREVDSLIDDEQCRRVMGSLGLVGEKALRKIGALSGGEKVATPPARRPRPPLLVSLRPWTHGASAPACRHAAAPPPALRAQARVALATFCLTPCNLVLFDEPF
jgi:ATP-binding cassette subfamily F protein 3